MDWLCDWAKAAELMIRSARTAVVRWRESQPSKADIERVIDRLTFMPEAERRRR